VHFDQTGTFTAGDMRVALPLSITLLASSTLFGPDGLPCTADDQPTSPPAPVTVVLSTGTNTINIYDAGNLAGVRIGPGAQCGASACQAQLLGNPVSCSNLLTGNVTGMILGGGFPALDTTASDIATVFQFALKP